MRGWCLVVPHSLQEDDLERGCFEDVHDSWACGFLSVVCLYGFVLEPKVIDDICTLHFHEADFSVVVGVEDGELKSHLHTDGSTILKFLHVELIVVIFVERAEKVERTDHSLDVCECCKGWRGIKSCESDTFD